MFLVDEEDRERRLLPGGLSNVQSQIAFRPKMKEGSMFERVHVCFRICLCCAFGWEHDVVTECESDTV